jgi:phosphate transport system protein
MINIEEQREVLNGVGSEMLKLCIKQLSKSIESFINYDTDLAEEVMYTENRVNALDLTIERDCEEFIAMFNPVATDLRFVLALRKINFDLERIGDHAYGIASYVANLDVIVNKALLELLGFKEMVTTLETMLENISDAYTDRNVKVARKVFKKDKKLDKINFKSFALLTEEIKKNPKIADQALLLFAIIKKIERVGDLLKNVAEEIIFYLEAEVIKHRKKK